MLPVNWFDSSLASNPQALTVGLDGDEVRRAQEFRRARVRGCEVGCFVAWKKETILP